MTPFAIWRSRLPAAIGSWFARDISRTALELVDRSRVRLRAVEATRVEGEVTPLTGAIPSFTAVAEWAGGTGPLALRSVCTCGANGVCEHVVATLETVRTSTDSAAIEDEALDWLPVPPAPAAARRARSLWVVFHASDSGALAATLYLDSPRLRGVAREAGAVLAMMESTPPDDWDDSDRALMREDVVIDAFNGKQTPRNLSLAMLRMGQHPRLRFAPDLRANVHPSELGDFATDVRGLRLMASVDGTGFAPIFRTRDGERVDPAKIMLLDSTPPWAATDRVAYLLDGTVNIKRVLAASLENRRTPATPTSVARVAPYLAKNDRANLGIVDAEKPSAEVALTWLEGALVASITFVDRVSKARAIFHPSGVVARHGEQLLFFSRQIAERIDARMMQAGFVPRGIEHYVMHGADRAAIFVREVWPTWKDFDRRIDRTLEDLVEPREHFSIDVAVRRAPSGEDDWFEMNVDVSFAEPIN